MSVEVINLNDPSITAAENPTEELRHLVYQPVDGQPQYIENGAIQKKIDSVQRVTTTNVSNEFSATLDYPDTLTGPIFILTFNFTNTAATTLILTPTGGISFASKGLKDVNGNDYEVGAIKAGQSRAYCYYPDMDEYREVGIACGNLTDSDGNVVNSQSGTVYFQFGDIRLEQNGISANGTGDIDINISPNENGQIVFDGLIRFQTAGVRGLGLTNDGTLRIVGGNPGSTLNRGFIEITGNDGGGSQREVLIGYSGSERIRAISDGVKITGTLIMPSPNVPATASAPGTTGMISWDDNYIYVCTATDTWKRVAIDTWGVPSPA